jgi:hypothetical protein
MKRTNNAGGGMDSARVALLFGLSLGLGIVVHESFFVFAGAIAVGAMAAAIANIIYDHTEQSGLTHQNR